MASLNVPALRHGRRSLALLTTLFTLTACGAAGPEPTGSGGEGATAVRNCGIEVTTDGPPERVFAAYQPAIEMAHALGISDRLVGTAFLDARVLQEYAEAQRDQNYHPRLPSLEELLDTGPDFVLSGFNGAFTDQHFGTRASLRELGVETWILSPLCPSEDGLSDEAIDPATVTMDSVYADLRDLGTLFGAEERAEEVIATMERTIGGISETVAEAERRPTVAAAMPDADGFRVAGGPDFATEIFRLAGGENAFADLDEARNITVSTEDLIERDPDYILVPVCCDADMTAADAAPHVEEIMTDPALANLTAVTEGHVVEFTFADRSAGVRSATVVESVAQTIHPEMFE